MPRGGKGSRARRRVRRALERLGLAGIVWEVAEAVPGEPRPAPATARRARRRGRRRRRPVAPAPEAWKWEAAEELGLAEKVRAVGWAGLTAREAGRVGGWVTRRRREEGAADPSA